MSDQIEKLCSRWRERAQRLREKGPGYSDFSSTLEECAVELSGLRAPSPSEGGKVSHVPKAEAETTISQICLNCGGSTQMHKAGCAITVSLPAPAAQPAEVSERLTDESDIVEFIEDIRSRQRTHAERVSIVKEFISRFSK